MHMHTYAHIHVHVCHLGKGIVPYCGISSIHSCMHIMTTIEYVHGCCQSCMPMDVFTAKILYIVHVLLN